MTHPEDCAAVIDDMERRIENLRTALEAYRCNKKHRNGYCPGERAKLALEADDLATPTPR